MNRAERRQRSKSARKKGGSVGGPAGDPLVARPASRGPGSPAEWLEAGRQAHEAGDLAVASDFYRRVLDAEPKNPDALHLLGMATYQAGDPKRAVQLISRAIKLSPRAADYHNNLGSIFNTGLARPLEAIASYRRALAINPNFAGAHNNIGIALQEIGRTDEAIPHFRQAIEINPDYVEAYRHLTLYTRHTEPDEILAAMERKYAETPSGTEARMHLGFALGKAYEDLGDAEKSFGFYVEGNRAQKQLRSDTDRTPDSNRTSDRLGRLVWKTFKKLDMGTEVNVVTYRNHVEALKKTFDAALFEKFPDVGCSDASPIFVVGMPRSGTTLVEQILASHSQVYGAGELSTLSDIARAFTAGHSVDFLGAAVGRAEPSEFATLGKEYVKTVRQRAGNAKFIVDKMPLNFHFIGLIRLILPNAKIVHCCRDPLDTGLSIFKRHFPSSAYRFACDLTEIGGNIKYGNELMDHWHRVLPGFVHDIHYERLVSDQKAETAALLEFCGLEWEDACLEFYKTERQVKTNTDRVRQPIYGDSVGTWKRYEKQLAPLIRALK